MSTLFVIQRSIILFLFISGFSIIATAQEISFDDLKKKHLESIASPEKLSKIRNFFLLGQVSFKFQGSAQLLTGKGLILSDKDRLAWAMTFPSNDYPQDKFGFDGKRVQIIRTAPSGRSFLTQFLFDNKNVVEDGLLGGAVSKGWIMNSAEKGGKFKVVGKKKSENGELIIVEYLPKGGSDTLTKLYFDSSTFRHVRSEHVVARAAAQGLSIDSSAGQTGTLVKLIEEFSEFKKMGDLMLPTAYKIIYSRSGAAPLSTQANTAREAEWVFKFTDFGVNQELSADAFNF